MSLLFLFKSFLVNELSVSDDIVVSDHIQIWSGTDPAPLFLSVYDQITISENIVNQTNIIYISLGDLNYGQAGYTWGVKIIG